MPKKRVRPTATPPENGDAVIAEVLAETEADVQRKKAEREAEIAAWRAADPKKRSEKQPTDFKEQLQFAISFGVSMGQRIARALDPDFPGIRGKEAPSAASTGDKRVDVSYSTPKDGLGLMVSLKSVHKGESRGEKAGQADFTHNIKRNDEELRTEATALHIRQPYAVLVAVLFLPFVSCHDGKARPKSKLKVSSFGRWVEKLWTLKGRREPEDPPNKFELVFVALYSPAYFERSRAERSSPRLGFYEVGGNIPCPREGEPRTLLSFTEFLQRMKTIYSERNSTDFAFEGSEPAVGAAEREDDEPDDA